MVVFGYAVVVAVVAVVIVVSTLALARGEKHLLVVVAVAVSPLSWKLLPYALLELVTMYVMMSTSALASNSHCRTAREKVALRRWSMPWRSTSKLIANTLRFVSVVLASATHPRALEAKAAIGDAVLVYVLSLPLLLLLLLPLALPLVMPLLLLLSLPDERRQFRRVPGRDSRRQASGPAPGPQGCTGGGRPSGFFREKVTADILGDR